MKTKEVIVSHPGDFIETLAENGKLFGTYSTPEGQIVLCFRKTRDTVYENNIGFGVLIEAGDIKHLLNILRLARQRARECSMKSKPDLKKSDSDLKYEIIEKEETQLFETCLYCDPPQLIYRDKLGFHQALVHGRPFPDVLEEADEKRRREEEEAQSGNVG